MPFDFSSISIASIAAETDAALAEAEQLVSSIVAPDAALTFEGRLLPLEDLDDRASQVFARTGFMGYVHPDPEVRNAGKEAEERLSKWRVDLAFRSDLYEAIKALNESRGSQLEGQRQRLLEFTMRDFRKAGHDLPIDRRTRLQELSARLVELGVSFERNIADDDIHVVATRDELSGMAPEYIESLEPVDADRFKITMAYPHVIPVLDEADNRDLRRRVFHAFNARATEANRPVLAEAVAARREIAALFEAPSWAHHRLDERMAKTPEAVDRFYAELIPPLTAAARADIVRMSKLLAADTGDGEVRAYDWRYYDNRLRKTEYGVDQNEVAAYFPLESVVQGMLDITAEVFGLRYHAVETSTWHPDVTCFAVFDTAGTDPLAHFYMDLFPREGKFTHAAAFPLRNGRRLADGSYQKPVSAIVANFTKPTGDRPSLLRHTEVETLFHEFGHILHQTLTRTELVRFAGTNTEGDFVEAPSQIMQHWVWKPDVLGRFARHHQTGEPIPAGMVDRLTQARLLDVAIAKLRQVVFGVYDLTLHGSTGPDLSDDEILRDATELGLFPFEEGTYFPAGFGHLLGGYDAGYYGYLWSEVYGDDMFSRFEKEGYLDPKVGADYRRHILEMGGSVDGLDMIETFLGRPADNAAFLVNLGIGTD